jgi:hypothetical protein
VLEEPAPADASLAHDEPHTAKAPQERAQLTDVVREEIARLVLDEGLSESSVAKMLGQPFFTVANVVRSARKRREIESAPAAAATRSAPNAKSSEKGGMSTPQPSAPTTTLPAPATPRPTLPAVLELLQSSHVRTYLALPPDVQDAVRRLLALDAA